MALWQFFFCKLERKIMLFSESWQNSHFFGDPLMQNSHFFSNSIIEMYFFFVILEGNLHFFQRIFWQNQNFFYHNLQAEVYIFLQSFDKIPHFTASFGNLLSLFFPNYSGLKFSFFSRMLKHNWHFHHASLAEICIFHNRLTKFTFFPWSFD